MSGEEPYRVSEKKVKCGHGQSKPNSDLFRKNKKVSRTQCDVETDWMRKRKERVRLEKVRNSETDSGIRKPNVSRHASHVGKGATAGVGSPQHHLHVRGVELIQST